MIKVIYNKVCGRCVQSEPLTSGMVGQPIHFEYSHDFDGLALTAVFTNGKTTVDVLNPGNQCMIPHEVLDTVGTLVNVGIYAVRGNELVIPTVYAHIGVVQKGADPSGDVSADPTLPVWAQIQGIIGNLNDLTTEAKNNLVAAINEAAQTGGGGGSTSIAMRVDGGYIQYSTDNGNTWVNLIAEADLKGDKGDKGADGAPGAPGKDGTSITISGIIESADDGGTNTVTFSDGSALNVKNGSKGSAGADGTDGITPHIGENGNWYIGSTDTGNPSRGATGPQGPAGAPGKDGADMGITGATVGQIAKITAVDDTGKPTAWQSVDMPSGGVAEEYELIFTDTVTEDIDGYFRDTDANGNTFALKKAILIVFTPPYEESDTSYGRGVGFLPTTSWGHDCIGNLRDSIKSSAGGTGYYDVIFAEIIMGYQMCTARFESQNTTNVFSNMQPVTKAGATGLQFVGDATKLMQFSNPTGNMTCVKIVGYASPIIAKNTQITLYGVRA